LREFVLIHFPSLLVSNFPQLDDSTLFEESEENPNLSHRIFQPSSIGNAQESFTFSSPAPTPIIPTIFPALPSLKRNNHHFNSPTPPSSPAKKRRRGSEVSRINSVPPMTLLEPVTPPAPTPTPNTLAADVFDHLEPPPLGGWDWDEEHDSDGSESESEDLGAPSSIPTAHEATKASTKTAPKGKLSLYWTIATKEEKDEQDQRDFQRIKDVSERYGLEEELAQQKKKLLNRAQVRDRVQRLRERVKAKKIDEGWVPRVGHKRVSL
jgi:hypothetical protein